MAIDGGQRGRREPQLSPVDAVSSGDGAPHRTEPSPCPVVRDLLSWGDEYYSVNGPRRVFRHAQDAGTIGPDGTCATCGSAVPPSDLLVLPGPGYDGEGDDFVSKTLTTAHHLLEPIRGH